MDSLSLDLWGYLSKFIEGDKWRCYLMMTCKEILNCKIYFSDWKCIDKIINVSRFDYFTNVHSDKDINKLPQYISTLSLGNKVFDYYIPSTITELIIGFNHPLKCPIPTSVIHLTFEDLYNQPIDGIIPFSVTHLSLDHEFNQCIDGIPLSVTHLFIGGKYPIKGHISSSITHLTFSWDFNQSITNLIPSSVIHLTFKHDFNHSVDNLSPNVK